MFREINALLSRRFGKGWRVSQAGSFLALRKDDPEGKVTVKEASEVISVVRDYFGTRLENVGQPAAFDYFMGGVVVNWRWH